MYSQLSHFSPQRIDIGNSGDNLFVEPDTGSLWIATHPILHRLIEHFKDKSEVSPSQVKILLLKCDTIKRNESDIANIDFEL